MAKRKKTSNKTRVKGYTMHRHGKTIHVKGFLRKHPKRK